MVVKPEGENGEIVPVSATGISTQPFFQQLINHDINSALRPVVPPAPRTVRFLGFTLREDGRLGWLARIMMDDPRRPFPSYHATAGNANSDILEALVYAKKITPKTMGEIVAGYLDIHALDTLATSASADTPTALRLFDNGYRLWPVDKDLSWKTLDLDTLRLDLSTSQLSALAGAKTDRDYSDESYNLAFWMKEPLGLKSRLLLQPYVPSLVEVLGLFQNFAKQEGYFPDTEGQWIGTGSRMMFSLNEAYKEFIGNLSEMEIFNEAFISQAAYANVVRNYINTPGEFKASTGAAKIQKSRFKSNKRVFEIQDSGGIVVFKSEEGLSAEGEFDKLYALEKYWGKIRYEDQQFKRENTEGSVVAEYPKSTILAQIKQYKAVGEEYFSQDRPFTLSVLSDRERGVRVGISPINGSNTAIWGIANNNLIFDCWSHLSRAIAEQSGGLDLVTHYLWPNTVAEKYSRALLRALEEPKK